MKSKVLIIEDEIAFWQHYQRKLSPLEMIFETAATPVEAISKLAQFSPDIILLDLSFEMTNFQAIIPKKTELEQTKSDLEGLSFLSYIRQQHPDCKIVVVTGNSQIENALEAIRRGATDFIEKGSGFLDALLFRVQAINERLRLEKTIRRQQNQNINRIGGFPYATGQIIVGTSLSMRKIFDQIERIAEIDQSANSVPATLITGETGTGKELVAQAIHYHSQRSDCPFLPLNCAAFPEDLIEDELFGHKKGAFSGATDQRLGAFEAANGGTIFLDEIGEMPLIMQPRLLRVLQEKKIKRIGENQERTVDVRVIAATTRDLRQSMVDGLFRQDLYFRLSALPINLPNLQKRTGDIRLLVQHFCKKFCQEYQVDRYFTTQAIDFLEKKVWDGNVRELMDVVQRNVLFSDSQSISVDNLDLAAKNEHDYSGVPQKHIEGNLGELNHLLTIQPYNEARKTFENWYVKKVYEFTDKNQSKTARMLGINRNTVRRILGR